MVAAGSSRQGTPLPCLLSLVCTMCFHSLIVTAEAHLAFTANYSIGLRRRLKRLQTPEAPFWDKHA